ncbi:MULTISPECIES: DUF5953 family protein [Methylobacter]|uniref:DUF5953 family protein n=1 Tax=Methylobacter TaxID=429 RepID=UPI00036504C5|nr:MULTISPECIES: DUF5953 family protein [Methylobacter]
MSQVFGVRHDLVRIIAPPLKSAGQIEEVYRKLEELFPEISQGGIAYPIGENTLSVSDRSIYIKNNLDKKGISLGDKHLNLYFTCSNISYPLGTTGVNYCRITLGIKRGAISISNLIWLKMISDICEKFDAYWGISAMGDDYYQLCEVLQRDRFFKEENNFITDKESAERIRELLGKYNELSKLPNLDLSGHAYRVHDLRIVPELGWINYWNQSICEYNGICDIPSIAGCETQGFKTNSAACVWSLTTEPWEIRKITHRKCIVEAYKSFPKVGLRLY